MSAAATAQAALGAQARQGPAREFAPRGVLEIAGFLDAKSQELAQLQNQLQEAHEEAEVAEIDWIEHYDAVIEDMEAGGEKLPGEEKCVGIARRRGGWEAWVRLSRAERNVKKLEKRASLIGNQISACQSEAKLLQAVES